MSAQEITLWIVGVMVAALLVIIFWPVQPFKDD